MVWIRDSCGGRPKGESISGTGVRPACRTGSRWDGAQTTRTSWPADCSAQPSGTIGTATFGQILSADDGRIIQLGVKYSF